MFIPGCEQRIVHKKLGFMVRVSYCTGVSADSFKDVIDFLCFEVLNAHNDQ